RRIEIARVLLHQPDLLLLDEPGRGVDPEALRRIWSELGALRESRALTRIVILAEGRVSAVGTPDELRARVAGDVVTVRGDEPQEIAAAVRARLGLETRVDAAGAVTIEAPRGHEVVPRIAELFAPGRLRSIATARP